MPTAYLPEQLHHKLYGTIPDILFNEKHDMFEPEKKIKELAVFEKRINGIPPEYRKYALAIYANPVVNKMRNKEKISSSWSFQTI